MNLKQRLVWIGAAAWVFVAVATVAGLSGCGQAHSQTESSAPKLPKVDVSYPAETEVTDYEEFTGRVDAANKVLVQAMVTGYLDKINFKDGQDVDQGDVLFEIDPRVYQANYDMATASVEQARARFERLTNDYQRGKQMVQNKSLSVEEFDKVAGDRLEASAAVGQAKAQLEQADVNLKFTKVLSPIKGRVSRRLIDRGNMVKANETQLTWIYQIDPMYSYFDVDERTVIKLRKLVIEGKIKSYRDGTIYVDVGLADEESFSLKGEIDWVDNVLDAGTGTLKVRSVIHQPRDPNKDEPIVLVSPGMFVRVRLPVSAPHKAVLISEKAVGTDQGEKYVLVVNKKKDQSGNDVIGSDRKPIYVVDRRNVTLGQMHHGLRVVEKNASARGKDLSPTDQVIVSGLQRVRKDAEVTVQTIDMPQPAGATRLAQEKNNRNNGNAGQ